MSEKVLNLIFVAGVIAIAIFLGTHVYKLSNSDTVIMGTDTVVTVINQEKFDSLKYYFQAKLDSVKGTKVKWTLGKTVIDTVEMTDTLYLSYSSRFSLGDKTLGVKGKVSFSEEMFRFEDITYKYPEKIKTVTDTLRSIRVIERPLLQNGWFYSTIGLAVGIVILLGVK